VIIISNATRAPVIYTLSLHDALPISVIMGHELCGEVVALGAGIEDLAVGTLVAVEPEETCGRCLYCGLGQYNHCPTLAIQGYNRSEEHTSELQSHLNLVCRLLLEKKK